MIDLVYTLGTGSKWEDNELRYSLRSVEKHLHGHNNVYIVGVCPDWLTDVIHIPMGDLYGYNRDRNIYAKIFTACRHNNISDDFLFMNDDHFFLRDFVTAEIPYYHKGRLSYAVELRPHGDNYRVTLNNAYRYLVKRNLPTKHFDVHTPIIYNKKAFIRSLSVLDWEVYYGYVIKSVYANSLKIDGELIVDCKIDQSQTRENIIKRITGRPFFSIGDNAINDDMKMVLQDLYPDPSRYEL